MTKTYSELVASTQQTIDSDTDFQNSLVNLSDEDKTNAISVKQQELLDAELASMEDRANKAEEIAKNQKIRAEKAEALAKGAKVEKETPKNESLSAKDVIAIRDLHEADVEFVMTEAKLRGISIAEAKANVYIANTLKVMAEERKTADATTTKETRKSNSSSSPAAVLQRAYKGDLKEDEMKDAASAVVSDIFNRK